MLWALRLLPVSLNRVRAAGALCLILTTAYLGLLREGACLANNRSGSWPGSWLIIHLKMTNGVQPSEVRVICDSP